MSTAYFCLHPDFAASDLINWYDTAAVGDTAIIALPSRAYSVRLLRNMNKRVYWGPEGARGVTIPLEDAVLRLQMLHDSGGVGAS